MKPRVCKHEKNSHRGDFSLFNNLDFYHNPSTLFRFFRLDSSFRFLYPLLKGMRRGFTCRPLLPFSWLNMILSFRCVRKKEEACLLLSLSLGGVS